MHWVDWLITILPIGFVVWIGIYLRRYIRGVADFVVAGRVAGRYVICVADLEIMLGVLVLIALCEERYKGGFGIAFWQNVTLPIGIFLSLTGYCVYRYRQTRAMSIGQFLEMRYNRTLRVLATIIRTVAEILTNMIGPAVAARFLVYFIGLPTHLAIAGCEVPTFMVITVILLLLCAVILWAGGTLALIVTDCVQGLICYPIFVIFCCFLLYKFSWWAEIAPVLADRVAGQSFLNPNDIAELRDFNLFALFVTLFNSVLNRASWIGGGSSGAAKTPHEQNMAALLGAWRNGLALVMCVLIALAISTFMNHRNFAVPAHEVRVALLGKISEEVLNQPSETPLRAELRAKLAVTGPQVHRIGVDQPLSYKADLDTPYLNESLTVFKKADGGMDKFQQYRTLFYQMLAAGSMRSILPVGMAGLFCVLIIMLMISTEDSRIFSSSTTIVQDMILPLLKKPFTPERHLLALRLAAMAVTLIFLAGGFFMAQLDYIKMFSTVMSSLWLGGAGPIMIFGLYSRFGTSAGALGSLFTGLGVALGGIMSQRFWASHLYPWFERMQLVGTIDNLLSTASVPFHPYIYWEMNPIKCPVNSMEISFIAMVSGLFVYIALSLLTRKEPYNLDRLLHRGAYADGESKPAGAWTWHNFYAKMIGITAEYSRGDRVIAWGMFIYSFVYQFVLCFLAVSIWNAFSPWPMAWWSNYFFITLIAVPGVIGIFTTVWFVIGGFIGLRQLFRDLAGRAEDALDNGYVENNISLADKAKVDRIENAKSDR